MGARRDHDDTAHEQATMRKVLGRKCPQCEAQPGASCRTRSGHELCRLDELHVSRRVLAPSAAPADRRPLATDTRVNDAADHYAPVYSARI